MRRFVSFAHLSVLLVARVCDGFRTSGVASSMNSQRVHVHSKTSIRSAGPGHSFVEGETYDDRFSEIGAMGGGTYVNCAIRVPCVSKQHVPMVRSFLRCHTIECAGYI